jgi:hypothetical protein
LASVAAPTYFSIIEKTCEIELADVGEEEENKGKEGAKDLDVKIYYSLNASFLYQSLEKKKRISFYSKNYTSYYKKLVSPPPELLS